MIQVGHMDTPFLCLECGDRMHSGMILGSHFTVHLTAKPFLCKECIGEMLSLIAGEDPRKAIALKVLQNDPVALDIMTDVIGRGS